MQNRRFTAFCLVIMPPKRPVFVGLLHGVTVVARKPHIFCGGAGHWRLAQNCPERVSLPPLGGRWRGTRRMRGICPVVAPSSVTCGDSFPQRGKPFGRVTRYIHYTIRLRAGRAPPLRGGEFCILRQPQVSPSSVGCVMPFRRFRTGAFRCRPSQGRGR